MVLLRTFIAFEPDEIVKEKYCQLIETGKIAFPEIKNWTKPENLHFTLRFIGDTEEAHIAEISQYLKNLANQMNVFELQKGNLSWYPFNNSPLICMMYQFHNSWLIKQYHLLGEFLESMKYETDRRRLNFHLTLARLKNINISQTKNWNSDLTHEVSNVKITRLVYYKSTLYKSGPVYEKIKEMNLKGGINGN